MDNGKPEVREYARRAYEVIDDLSWYLKSCNHHNLDNLDDLIEGIKSRVERLEEIRMAVHRVARDTSGRGKLFLG